jgi:hypothetical protein
MDGAAGCPSRHAELGWPSVPTGNMTVITICLPIRTHREFIFISHHVHLGKNTSNLDSKIEYYSMSQLKLHNDRKMLILIKLSMKIFA